MIHGTNGTAEGRIVMENELKLDIVCSFFMRKAGEEQSHDEY
jgi:hypothetical protein